MYLPALPHHCNGYLHHLPVDHHTLTSLLEIALHRIVKMPMAELLDNNEEGEEVVPNDLVALEDNNTKDEEADMEPDLHNLDL